MGPGGSGFLAKESGGICPWIKEPKAIHAGTLGMGGQGQGRGGREVCKVDEAPPLSGSSQRAPHIWVHLHTSPRGGMESDPIPIPSSAEEGGGHKPKTAHPHPGHSQPPTLQAIRPGGVNFPDVQTPPEGPTCPDREGESEAHSSTVATMEIHGTYLSSHLQR